MKNEELLRRPRRSYQKDPRMRDYEDGVYYPSGDGKPMAETGILVEAMVALKRLLEVWLKDRRPDAYIGIDMFWYWEKGNRRAHQTPDLFVALGIPDPKARRNSFRSWLEGGAIPAVIFEMASQKTWQENLGKKRELYEKVGVKEYFIFDPLREFMESWVVGWRLARKRYREVKADAARRLKSEELEVWLEPDLRGLLLRLRDPETGALILLPEERIEELRKQREQEQKIREEVRRQTEEYERRADAAEAEVARLRRLLRGRH